MVVGPVLVTVEAPSIEKLCAEPRNGSANAVAGPYAMAMRKGIANFVVFNGVLLAVKLLMQPDKVVQADDTHVQEIHFGEERQHPLQPISTVTAACRAEYLGIRAVATN
jgi:hypothetical protein